MVIRNYFLYDFCADTKRFKKDLRVIHVRDLNFVLWSEIFAHWDGQLRASHLIFGLEPMYSTWQAFRQALLVGNPLLSYIDVRYANFLPLRLTVREARDLVPVILVRTILHLSRMNLLNMCLVVTEN